RVLVLASAGPAVAASRSGGLGVLDRGWPSEPGRALEMARRAARYVDRPFGIRLGAEAAAAFRTVEAPENLRGLILDEPGGGDWPAAIGRARASGRLILAEVTSRASARSAARVGADGLIVAGHEAGGFGGEESSSVLLQGVLADGGPPAWVRGGIGPN